MLALTEDQLALFDRMELFVWPLMAAFPGAFVLSMVLGTTESPINNKSFRVLFDYSSSSYAATIVFLALLYAWLGTRVFC